MTQWLIYKHTCIKSGKAYIGLTKQGMELRWQQHIRAALIEGYTTHFANAIRLYGIENWEHEILVGSIDTLEEACALEKYYIKKYNTFEGGYNLTIGGESTYVVPEVYSFYNPELDILETMTAGELARKYGLHEGYVRYVDQGKVNYCAGWFLWKGASSNYNKDVVYSFEHKDYGIETGTLGYMADKYGLSKGTLCMVAKGNRRYTNGWTTVGNQKVLYEEVIPHNASTIVKVCIDTNEVVAEYPSIIHAAKENNLSEGVVGDRCRGRCKTNNVGGFSFHYKERINELNR